MWEKGYDAHGNWYVPLDKEHFSNKKISIIFLFLHKNICCGYSLEAPCWNTSNEYPQHMFLCKNKNFYMGTPLI